MSKCFVMIIGGARFLALLVASQADRETALAVGRRGGRREVQGGEGSVSV